MFLSADTMAYLFELGLSGERLVELVRRLDADALSVTPVAPPPADPVAERRRAYDRERKRVRGNSTGIPPENSAEIPPETPLPSPRKEKSPEPPKETQPHPAPKELLSAEPTQLPVKRLQPTKAELDAIWDITPKLGRERSGRRDLERSLTAAMRRGHDPSAIRSALMEAYASTSFSGDHAKGVHRLIENDRWQSFVAEGSNVVQLDPAQLQARQRAIGEWADEQARGGSSG